MLGRAVGSCCSPLGTLAVMWTGNNEHDMAVLSIAALVCVHGSRQGSVLQLS